MDRFEYVIALMAIITGLGLSDAGLSLHRLMKRRSRVRWDWLPLAVAAYLSFSLIRLWYQLWTTRDAPGVTDLLFFITLVAETFLLFLAVAAALPDEDDFDGGTIDLRDFYVRHQRYIWTLFTTFTVAWTLHAIYFGLTGNASAARLGVVALVVLIPLVIGGLLAVLRGRRWHVAGVCLLLVHEAAWMVWAGL